MNKYPERCNSRDQSRGSQKREQGYKRGNPNSSNRCEDDGSHKKRRTEDNYRDQGHCPQNKGHSKTAEYKSGDIISRCDYCGDDIYSNSEYANENHKIYHTLCKSKHSPRAECAIKAFRNSVPGCGQILLLPIHVDFLYGLPQEHDKKRKKEKRDIALRKLSNYVSALRNSGSGNILIHLVGLGNDNYTGYFDEFADKKLKDLIRNGSLFTENYRKQRLCDCADIDELKQFTDFIVLYVDGASYLTTTEFHSKVALDDGIIDPSDLNIYWFLKKRRQYGNGLHDPGIRSSRDLTGLQENRSIQFKGYFISPGEDVVASVLQKHRLSEYLSAFTKLDIGGSYFYGVTEKDTTISGHKSKELVVQCVPVGDSTTVESELINKLRDTVLVCDYDGEEINTDLVRVRFISSCNGDRSRCTAGDKEYNKHFVIQVSAKPVSGIVFYDRKGPVAYRFEDDSIKPYTVKEWFSIFMGRQPLGYKTTKTDRGRLIYLLVQCSFGLHFSKI